ncbi:MAG: glutamine--tRNA ligase/YqeY domain fusion protein [Proteobacteria bacterium]|nr:MAG: glutamine--tRNA ligase/YqeY domain fusion protein [Pseudomonadota bacterium]QKK12041.1 MAG: glutamine--tRNA ligase/YqeY domain fusion protein [Pseudomonadota bacterium]
MGNTETPGSSNFIRDIIDADLSSGKHDRIVTRFPPEPNGYLHIGHAKSICLNFGIARDYPGAICHLRFDDTNPHKENIEFVDAICEDVHWLGFDWQDKLFYASDYFDRLFEFAMHLIDQGEAYVCELTPDEMREYRGTLKEPGRESPYRNRSVAENRDLFQRMRAGEFADGSRTLRARIDMAAPNINLRDPVIYRIKHGAVHHQTGQAWCIYPMYDFAHSLSDAIEGITHSLCTLEFEDHRSLYDWFQEHCGIEARSRQLEFSRLELEHTVLSKRKLTRLVSEGHVTGWDDPRMPTLAGMRRRGYPPAAIRNFCNRIGVTKSFHRIEMGLLESCIREELDISAPRRMAVLRPIRVVIENYPADREEEIIAANHPKDEAMGQRTLRFTREIYIDREDFREEAPNKYKRLVTGGEVRLRNAYVIRCDEVVKDSGGEIHELRCSYDPATLITNPDGRKVRGVIHWVSARSGVQAEVRLYERLFANPDPEDMPEGQDFMGSLNPDSLQVLDQAVVEPELAEAPCGSVFQFEREGYFCRDASNADGGKPVFNRVVTLRDSWVKIENRAES